MKKNTSVKLLKYFSHDIWHMKTESFPRWQRWFIRLLRIVILGVRGYNEKNLVHRASALTLYTILSIVPVIAMIFGIAQGFGLEEYLTRQLKTAFASQPEVLANLLNYAHNLLSNTKGGLIAGFGFILLVWSVVQVLGNIESAFNAIWYVERGRSWPRKFTDYLSIMMVAPIFIILSGTANIFLSTEIKNFARDISFLGSGITNLIVISINLVPYLTTSLLFFLVYLVMPNIRIQPKSAFWAGVIAGSFFQVFQWIYIVFQVGVSRYNGIYGSFASIPLFIIWLQYSWIIVLVGAEIAYCMQNLVKIEGQIQTNNLSHKMRMLYSLYILKMVAQCFKDAQKAPDTHQVSEQLDIPQHLAQQLIDTMLRCNLIAETIEEYNKERCYVPAMDISYLQLGFVINRLESLGSFSRGDQDDDFHRLKVHYNALEEAMNKSSYNKNILDV